MVILSTSFLFAARHASRALRASLVFAIAAGCGGAQTHAAAPADIPAGRCDATLPPPLPAIAPARSTLRALRFPQGSSIPFEVGIDLARARKELEAQVPARVAEEHGRDIGAAGRLTLTIDRGPFRFAVEQGKLSVLTDLTAHAQVCKPLGGLGCVQYASCDPTAVARASVPEALTKEARFAPSSVTIDIGRRCVVTALNIDVTPIVEQEARAETKKVEERIDRALPDLHGEAERAWHTLEREMPLRQGACVALHPRELVQGPSRVDGDRLVVRLGVNASPLVTMPCPPAPPETPLPPLRFDPTLSDTFALHVPVARTPDALAASWESALKGKTLAAGGGAVRIESMQAALAAEAIALDVGVSGPACGSVSFVARPSWDAQRSLHAFDVAPREGVVDRVRAVAPGVDVAGLARTLAAKLDDVLPVDDASLGTALDGLKVPLAQGGPELHVDVTEHAPEPIVVTSSAVEPRFLLRGRAQIDVK
jgi:hypothetical protein